jgi:catechol 2,3-dioxygenase-like lactoylglutathione lyase family enzyme
MPINFVGTVSVFVTDQQRAKDFYTNTLGFELRTDAELYPGSDVRWIAVAPKGGETELILYLPDEAWAHYQGVVGKSQAITLNVTDLKAVYQELKSKGVKFVQEPDAQTWGTFATFMDSEGNQILLVELPKS